MIAVLIFLFIVLLLFLILFGTDFVVNKVSNLKRFRIGAWSSYDEWENAIKKKSILWLKKTPTVKFTDNYKYLLLDMINGKYRSDTVQSWQMAGLALGIYENKTKGGLQAVDKWKDSLINSDGMWKNPINKVDFALLSYAVLKTEKNPQRIRKAMDWTVNMLEQNLCDDGMISYSQGKNSDVRYVDTLGMVCAFLALYGKVYNQKKYIDLSFNQIESFRKSGLYENTQLPCHAFNSKLQLPLGVFGWGRGTVWYTLALVDTYEQITDKKQKDEMKSWIELSAEEYKGYQKDNGGFYTIMQDNGQYDSSATAGMAYFYRKCATIFNNNEYDKIADKCIERLMQVTMKNGAIDQCQGDTHGIGVFSQVFDIMPFAQGLTLRAIKNKG